jgi:hypothetical protein
MQLKRSRYLFIVIKSALPFHFWQAVFLFTSSKEDFVNETAKMFTDLIKIFSEIEPQRSVLFKQKEKNTISGKLPSCVTPLLSVTLSESSL